MKKAEKEKKVREVLESAVEACRFCGKRALPEFPCPFCGEKKVKTPPREA